MTPLLKIVSDITKGLHNRDLDNNVSMLLQRQIYLTYSAISGAAGNLPSFRDAGFRVYSQSDEDGLLLFIFSLLGIRTRLLVDIACGSPRGANATNLILNWGFHGLLVEADGKIVRENEIFYKNHPETLAFPPRIVNAWITAENINNIISKNGFSGEIDLLSLDVDGIDYWLWDSLQAVSPRVVLVEYQDCFLADEAVTVPYSPDFNRFKYHRDYFGASLAAFVKLAQQRNYRLVGCNRYGYNAFFVRNDLTSEGLPAVDPSSCLLHPRIIENRKQKRAILDKFPWQEV